MPRSDPGPGPRSRRPPSGPPRSPTGPVVVCRLRVPLPGDAWIAAFSREHPEVRLEILSRIDLAPGRSLTELRLLVPGEGPWAEELAGRPQVRSVEVLGTTARAVRLRVVHRTSAFVPIFRRLRLMRRFPFTIQDGEATWIVRAAERKVDDLLARLRERVPGVRVEAVRHDLDDGGPGLLTRRQAEVFRRAMDAGYFDVPRRVTLTELAGQMGLAISSLSESLAVIEKKLLSNLPTAALADG